MIKLSLVFIILLLINGSLVLATEAVEETGFTEESKEALVKIKLTPEEEKWIKEHPIIKHAPDPDYAPYEFFDKETRDSEGCLHSWDGPQDYYCCSFTYTLFCPSGESHLTVNVTGTRLLHRPGRLNAGFGKMMSIQPNG